MPQFRHAHDMPGFQIDTTNQDSTPCGESDRFPGGRAAISSLVEPDPNIEVARSYRWVYETITGNNLSPLGDAKKGILLYAHKSTRPQPEVDEVIIHHGQTQIKRPGKIKWNNIDITFYEKCYDTGINTNRKSSLYGVGEGIYNEVAERVYEWYTSAMINTSNNYTNSPKKYHVDSLLKMLDGAGYSIWAYKLFNCWPVKITPTELDYSNSALAEITLTLSYDKAEEARIF